MVRGCGFFKGAILMIEAGFMGIVFNDFLHFPDLWELLITLFIG